MSIHGTCESSEVIFDPKNTNPQKFVAVCHYGGKLGTMKFDNLSHSEACVLAFRDSKHAVDLTVAI